MRRVRQIRTAVIAMPTARRVLQSIMSRHRRPNVPGVFAVVRVTGLVLLFLLPMQMRAGAADPHPHAMLQLLIDARDGTLDHHEDDHAAEPAGHESTGGTHEPDLPKTEASNVAGGAMALLAALMVKLLTPAARRVTIWSSPGPCVGWLPGLDPPPPRVPAV